MLAWESPNSRAASDALRAVPVSRESRRRRRGWASTRRPSSSSVVRVASHEPTRSSPRPNGQTVLWRLAALRWRWLPVSGLGHLDDPVDHPGDVPEELEQERPQHCHAGALLDEHSEKWQEEAEDDQDDLHTATIATGVARPCCRSRIGARGRASAAAAQRTLSGKPACSIEWAAEEHGRRSGVSQPAGERRLRPADVDADDRALLGRLVGSVELRRSPDRRGHDGRRASS